MAMINYADKVALNSNDDIADINKVNATDMNELKNAFNNQVAQGWYKTGINPTFTFVSYDSETLTGVVSSNLDLTPYLSVGMKVKFTQSGVTKYGIITKITSNQITLFMGQNYTLNNSGISNAFYSMLKAPFGFDTNPKRWSLQLLSKQEYIQSNPGSQGILNIGGLNIKIPVGVWEIYFNLPISITLPTAGYPVAGGGISTSKNNISDKDLYMASYVGQASVQFVNNFSRKAIKSITSTTTYYLIERYENNPTNVTLNPSGTNTNGYERGSIYVEFKCAYL